MQLVKSMGLPLVGVLKSPSIPSVATVQCEQPSHPARVYGNRGIVIFVCEISLVEVILPLYHPPRSLSGRVAKPSLVGDR